MSEIPTFIKDPDAELDYAIDWGEDWLKGADVIATSTWIITSENIASPLLSISSSSVDAANKVSTVWLAGGKNNKTYTVTNRIITTAGRKNDQSIYLKIQNK